MTEVKVCGATDQKVAGDARQLFREYEAWLGLDLCFQGFENELAELPGKYVKPGGRLYVAYADGGPAGCVAFRPFDEETAEMKRLFVRPGFQGLGIGRKLVELVLEDSRRSGYYGIVLDTYPAKMGTAIELYTKLGFREISPYYANPHAGVLFMKCMFGSATGQMP